MPGKILMIRGGAIGDFILTLPALAALRQNFPQSRLEVLGYPHIAQLALAGGLVDHVRSIDAGPMAGFFARNGSLDASLQEYFHSFSVIISYLYDPEEVFQANVARCTKAPFLAGPHRPDETAGLHATKVFLRPLERLAIFDSDPVPRLRMKEGSGNENTGRQGEGGIGGSFCPSSASLALHPGSGSERKNWPETKWAELLHQLIGATALRLLLVGGEAEGERLARLAQGLPRSRIQVAKSLPLTELARRLSECAAFVGHDSGITHLAAAVGLPALVLWGDSAEAIWRPQGRRLNILKDAAGLLELSVARVFREVIVLVGL